ncbi:MAG TPA: hypothetical protein VJH20_05820 [Candidatus Nanoarchaeia archaeon]|nr:hypothetical protein [Candidatus Nanoarchaeia archaeon]
MKFILYILVLFFAVDIVHSQNLIDSFNYREVYAAGETVQFEVVFDGILDKELGYSNLKLVNNVGSKINVQFNVEEINSSKYFVYFNLPNNLNEGTYRFVIHNVDMFYNGEIYRVGFEDNFTVAKSNYSIAIDPAFISLQNPISYFNIRNNKNNAVNLLIFGEHLIFETSNLTLGKLKDEDIQFMATKNIYGDTEIIIEYGDMLYKIPILVLYRELQNNSTIVTPNLNISNITVANKSVIFVEGSNIINLSLFTNETISAPLRFYNNGNVDIKDLKVVVSEEISDLLVVNQSIFKSVKVGHFAFFEVYLNKYLMAEPGNYKGTIKLVSDVENDVIFVYLNYKTSEKQLPIKGNRTENYNQTNKTTVVGPIKEKSKNLKIIIFIGALIIAFTIIIFFGRKNKPKDAKKNFSYYLRQ